jgi:hypothetical protein
MFADLWSAGSQACRIRGEHDIAATHDMPALRSARLGMAPGVFEDAAELNTSTPQNPCRPTR